MALPFDCPSDGYIWTPAETAFQLEVNGGYTLEMYQHKTGYAPSEPVATHTRRRYRLMPSKFANPSGPQPDPSLWIIHYAQCDPNDRVPSNVIPLDMRAQNTIQTRAYLHQQGQIVQKEFMLHDRANWPQITFPRSHLRGPAGYGSNVLPARVPQTMAYPPHQPSAAPPAKRARTQASISQNVAASGPVAVLDVDDDEDASRGDMFDHFTPRDISSLRYKQNHEWMEEVLSSPYSINQIIPVDLGLGIRGELSSLTEGIFDAPLDPEKDAVKNSYVGRLDPGKADEFRKKVAEHVEKTNKDLEKLKAKHAKRMEKFKKDALLVSAEKELRTAVNDPSDVGPEYWRLEGKIDEENGEDGKVDNKTPSKVDDILAKVEASLGRHAVAVQELRRIQDGGYEEPAPPPPSQPSPEKTALSSLHATPHSGVLGNDTDMEMGNSAAGLLDQYHQNGLSSNATPGSNFGPSPQPHLQAPPSAATPGMQAPSPQPVARVSPQPQPQPQAQPQSQPPSQQAQPQPQPQPQPQAQAQAPQQDVSMANANEQSTSTDGTGDWVVVPPGGVSPVTAPNEPSTSSGVSAPPTIPTVSPNPTVTAENTPLPSFSTSPNNFGDLSDLDTAGEALANYSEMGGDGDLSLDMDVGMDDSAFGEAFHGVEPREQGDDNGDNTM